MTTTKLITGILYFITAIAVALLLSSCSPRYCQPSKRSLDYATVLKLILRSDGYIHSIARNSHSTYQAFYECKPDSVQVGSIVWVGNYQRVRTGSGMKISVGFTGVNKVKSKS